MTNTLRPSKNAQELPTNFGARAKCPNIHSPDSQSTCPKV